MSDFHVPRGLDPLRQAQTWLDSTYRGLVEPAAPEPVTEDFGTWHFACRAKRQPGYPETPMLAATVVVPKDGSVPFHPAANDPWGDVEDFIRSRSPRTAEVQARKLNSRGCAVTVGSAVAGAPSSPLPWSPSHEAPGWWDILLRRYFPEAEVLECAGWDEVIAAAREPGPGTQGVVWLRREIKGLEATGHLLYVHNNNGNVVLLDGMSSGLGRMETEGVRALTFARCRPAGSPEAPLAPPWQRPADGFAAAVAKAEAWLERTYQEPVVLVAPGPDDERERGWLFACNTTAFLDHHDVNHAMLDAALVVPKSAAEPFGLPNSTPWAWFDAWNRAEGDGALQAPPPPRPGPAAWLPSTLQALGRPLSASEHVGWDSLLAELSALPVGARALIWVRRTDGKGRETVGLVLTALRTGEGSAVIDGSEHPVTDLNALAAWRMHLIRYR
ncbi:YrhB domain-containing protein [Streptomyces sp. NPDC007983]|uniref:YrhB domain-containing protein n=1 Tax=Streptomyces sp. NPDC007983 TaxID=3364800 RepID=UPI0036E80134